MTLKEYCKATENSTNKMIYVFTDINVEDCRVKAKSVKDFLSMQREKVLYVLTNKNIDYVVLDCKSSKYCEVRDE